MNSLPIGRKVKGSGLLMPNGDFQFTPYKKRDDAKPEMIIYQSECITITRYAKHYKVSFNLQIDNLSCVKKRLRDLTVKCITILDERLHDC